MPELFFGMGWGDPGREVAAVAERVAGEHEAWFTVVDLPGDPGPRYWFSFRNRGAPFDSQTARAVAEGLAREGLSIDRLSEGRTWDVCALHARRSEDAEVSYGRCPECTAGEVAAL